MRSVLEGRIGLLGDVHAEDDLLEEAVSQLAQLGIEQLLCTGDLVDGFGDVDRVCNLLLRHRVPTVCGNHDRWLLSDSVRDLPDASRREHLAPQAIGFLSSLPRTLEFTSPPGRVLLCHGLGSNDISGVTPDDYGYALESNLELQRLIDARVPIVLNGHTHRPMVRQFGETTIVNAGTLFRKDEPGYVVVDFGIGAVHWHAL